MAEEEKKTVDTTAEKAKEDPATTVAYEYKVVRYKNGSYDVQPISEDGKTPSIDVSHAFRDAADFGSRLKDELQIQESVGRAINYLSQNYVLTPKKTETEAK